MNSLEWPGLDSPVERKPDDEKLTLKHAYQTVFGTQHGQKVLEDLCRFKDQVIAMPGVDPSQAYYKEGQRSIYAYITKQLESE